MAEFPPNLDDGELYLPSDIFLSERIPAKFNPRDHHHHHRRHLSCMDELAHHFSALSLLQQTRPTPLKAHNQLERFKPPVGCAVVKPQRLQPGYLGVNGGVERGQSTLHEYGTGSSISGLSQPGFNVQFLNSTPGQLERYLQARTNRVLQKQQNRLPQQNQNRVLLYQRGGFGNNGGLQRESGGTGVFHPRIINSSGSGSDANKKKRQSVRERQELRVSQQRNTMERVGVSKREDCYYHLPADMRLPRDWTY